MTELDQPVSVEEFRGAVLPLPKEIIKGGVLYAGGKVIIHGRRKYKKSMFIWWALNQMRDGKDLFPTLKVETQGVSSLYMQAEIAAPLFQKRDLAMHKTYQPGVNPQSVYVWNTNLKVDTVEGIHLLDTWIEKLMPLDVVVIDPLYKFLSQDITSPAAVTAFMDNVDALIKKYGIGVIIIAHPRKSYGDNRANKGEDDPDDLLGASTWYNWVDAIMKITHPGNAAQDVYVMKFSDLRYAEEEVPDIVYGFNRQTLGFYPTVLV